MRGAGRWLTVVGMTAAAFAGGAFMQWLMGGGAAAAAEPTAAKEIRAQHFVLVDAEGKEYARLERAPESSGNGTVDYAGLRFFDRHGARRVTVGARTDGLGAGLGLWYTDGQLAIGMGAGPEGTGVTLHDAKGRERAGVGMPPWAGASFVTKDENGKETWRSP
jgi:hypothetical protein